MASGRFVSTSIAEDDRLSRLSLTAEFVYLKTIPHLDRDGMITGKPGLLYSRVCPAREELFGAVLELVDEWVAVGLVIRFNGPEGAVLFFPGFLKNNTLPHYNREKPSRFPPPPGYIRTDKGLVPADVQELVQELVQDTVPHKSVLIGSEVEVEVKEEEQVEVKENTARTRSDVHPQTQPIMDAYIEVLGYTPANYGKEAAAAKRLAKDDRTPADVVAAYLLLKAEPFWQKKHLSLQTVAEQLPALQQAMLKGIPLTRTSSTNGYMSKGEKSLAAVDEAFRILEERGIIHNEH